MKNASLVGMPDVPIYRQDFKNAAVQAGSTVAIGSRIFSDITERGKYYTIARRVNQGLPLRTFERAQTSGLPDELLRIYYFSSDAMTDEALSLQGLRNALDAGVIVLGENERYQNRLHITHKVIDTALESLYDVEWTTY